MLGARLPVTLLLALALGTLPGPALAQRGRQGPHLGTGGQRGTGPRATEDYRAGPYGLTSPDVVDAIEKGEGRQALAAYEQLAGEAESRGALAVALRAHSAAASAARRLGLLQKALREGLRAMEIGRQMPPTQSADVAAFGVAAINLGRAYYTAGDRAEARRVLDEGLAFMRAASPRGYPNIVATLLMALSRLDAVQGDQAAAGARAREGVGTLEAVDLRTYGARGRANHWRNLVAAYQQLARVALAGQRLDEASEALRLASEAAKGVALRQVNAEIELLAADVALRRGDHAEALRLLAGPRSEFERLGMDHLLYDVDRFTALAQEKQGRVDEALASATRAVGRVEDWRGDLQDPALRASFLEQRQGVYALGIRLALRAGEPETAFALAERARSRAFLDLLGNEATLSKGRTRALVQEELRLRAQIAEAAAAAQDDEDGTAGTAARERGAATRREYRAFLDRVRRESVEQASLMTVEPVTVPEIQALLPENTTLVEYLVGERELVLWIVDRHTIQVRRVTVSRATLLAEVRDFRAAIETRAPLADVEARATALYRRLLAPAASAIRGERLLVAPHDVLHYVPFAALRGPDGRWLVESYVVATVPSASVLKYLGDKGTQASDRILAVGNPDVGAALALPYAEREVRAIGTRFPSRTTVLTRGDATESQAKALGAQVGLLHFAVHGELSQADPMSSALLLAPGQGDDGRLEVRELLGLQLDARLVVLSACETALGALSRGDELVGLQRAFLYAGTPAVVTTLWKVDDRASFLLMRAFYDGLDPRHPAAALRGAQRALLATEPHPVGWAAFAVTGVPW